VARRRTRWKRHQGRLDPRRLVFIDETWARTNMTRTRGWAPRGKRLVAKAPFGKWRTFTFLAALRHDRIEAPVLFVGRINGRNSAPMSKRPWCPRSSRMIVVIDNLGSHKGHAIRAAIRKAGARLFIFLPPYSQTSIPSSSSSPSSRACCAKPAHEPSLASSRLSRKSSIPAPTPSAQIIFAMPVTRHLDYNSLYALVTTRQAFAGRVRPTSARYRRD
jgi:DDE superfamily endonuclease